MGGFFRKTVSAASDILADIRTGDIIAMYAAVWSIVIVGAAVILAQENLWLGLGLLLLSPVPILALTILTKMLLSSFTENLAEIHLHFEKLNTDDGIGLRIRNDDTNRDLDDPRIEIKKLVRLLPPGANSRDDMTWQIKIRSFPRMEKIGYGSTAFLQIAGNTNDFFCLTLEQDFVDNYPEWEQPYEDIRLATYEIEIEVRGRIGGSLTAPCSFTDSFVYWDLREFHEGTSSGVRWFTDTGISIIQTQPRREAS